MAEEVGALVGDEGSDEGAEAEVVDGNDEGEDAEVGGQGGGFIEVF
ncbi:MAG: hypothetical protein ACJA1W_002133 [Akkermansiaceae bacterium]